MKQEELSRMKTSEIAERARRAGVKNVEQMNKEQMIQAMTGGQAEAKKPGRGHAPQPPGTGPQEWKNIPGNQS